MQDNFNNLTNNLLLNREAERNRLFFDINTMPNLDNSSSFSARTFEFVEEPYIAPTTRLETNLTAIQSPFRLALDKKKPYSFSKFASFARYVTFAIEHLYSYYPAALKIVSNISYIQGSNIWAIVYDPQLDETTFKINTNYFENPFDIRYVSGLANQLENPLRDLTSSFLNYDFEYREVRFPIISFSGALTNTNSHVTLKVKGKPFNEYTNVRIDGFITPKPNIVTLEIQKLDDLALYMLGDVTGGFYFEDYLDSERNPTQLLFTQRFEIPRIDKYNLALNPRNPDFQDFATDIVAYAEKIDEQRTNLLVRNFVPQNLIFTETPDGVEENNLFKVLTLWGRMFDDISRYTDGIRLARTFNLEEGYGTPESYYAIRLREMGIDFADNIPVHIQRNLLAYLPYLYRKKGTRSAIEFIRDLCSIPRGLYVFDEYVYVTNPLNRQEVIQYLQRFDAFGSISNLPIAQDGSPIMVNTDTNYFQKHDTEKDEYYFDYLLNVIPQLTKNFTILQNQVQSSQQIYAQDFDFSGNPLTISLSGQTANLIPCLTAITNEVQDPFNPNLFDDCGCVLPLRNESLQICLEPNPLTGCTNIRLDAWYECIDDETANLQYRIIGGNPPYSIIGINTGDTLQVGDTYSFYALDVSGCPSNVVEFEPFCFDLCDESDLSISLSYTCNTDGLGNNDGTAILNVAANGGQPPYAFTGGLNGDTVLNGQTIVSIVIDSQGCTKKTGIFVNCPPFIQPPCNDIVLEASLETVQSNVIAKKAQVNFDCTLFGIPPGVDVDTFTISAIGNPATNPFLIGSPVISNFTTSNTSEKYDFDFNPSVVPFGVTMIFTLNILLTNGCEYTDTVTLTVNPRRLGNVANYTNTLIAIP